MVMRLVLGVLLLANVAVALILFKPWGGSDEDLLRQMRELQTQVTQSETRLAQAKALVTKVERASKEGDQFLTSYAMDRRSTFSTIIAELDKAASDAGIKPKERSIVLDPIEGSETLSIIGITAGYEGTYGNLTKFVNLLDKSARFVIIESLQAAPQQSGTVLSVSIKMNLLVREQAGGRAS